MPPGKRPFARWQRDDDRVQYARDRREHGVALYGMIQAAVGEKTLEEWDPIFRANDIWFAKVQSVEEVLEDEQAAPAMVSLPPSAADTDAALRDESGLATDPAELRTVASPVDFDSVLPQERARGPVPTVGEHTAAVLREVGVADETVERILLRPTARPKL